MTAVFRAIDIPIIHKRKRAFDDLDDDEISEYQPKRRTPTVLPFRSPPQTRPSISVTPPVPSSLLKSLHNYQPPFSAPARDRNDNTFPLAEGGWHLHNSMTHSPTSTNQGAQSLPHSPSSHHHHELQCPPMIRSHSGRARSNDLISPQRLGLPDLLSLPDQPRHLEQNRIPTPISTTFDHGLMDRPKPARQAFQPTRSQLSPMIEQESWIPHRSVFTNHTDPDDAMMSADESMDHTHQRMEVSDMDAMDTEYSHPPQRSMTTDHNQRGFGHERQRSARLHMGFMSGCEKCAQKLPGHYSHILWS